MTQDADSRATVTELLREAFMAITPMGLLNLDTSVFLLEEAEQRLAAAGDTARLATARRLLELVRQERSRVRMLMEIGADPTPKSPPPSPAP